MQRFSFFVLCVMCANAANSAYLPTVDVSRGGVSARAAFGEEIAPVRQSKVESVARNTEPAKKVVTRSTKKTLANNNVTAGGDILRPNRPRSDLWVHSDDVPLRMPRVEEIAVLDSDAVLPEESLDSAPKLIARDEALDELKQLRSEIARLSALQQESIARARPVSVRTPIAGNTDVKPAVKSRDESGVRREVVPMDTEKEIARRGISNRLGEPKVASVSDMSKMSPSELKKAFKKTYLSENKHLSTYKVERASKYDTASDMSVDIEGFNASRDLSEMDSGVRPMEVKISFFNNDSGLSRDNYNLLSETASIVVNNPKRAIQIAIPESATHDKDTRKLAARRLAIVEQVLRDTGIAEQRIVPVLSQRDGDEFVLRIISGETFESLTQQKRDARGNSGSRKTYKSMSW